MNEVVGAYAIVLVDQQNPNLLIGAKKGSPLVIGIGQKKGEFFIASDATPIIEYTRQVSYLEDEEIVIIKRGELSIKTLENIEKTPFIQELSISLEAIEKGGYEHFMLKEIFEQPVSVGNSLRGRFSPTELKFAMSSLVEYEDLSLIHI